MLRRTHLVLVLSALVAGLIASRSYAQNPIQAAKDAWKKAQQQSKQQQQQQQPNSGQQNSSTQAGTASAGAATQDASAPWTPPGDAAAGTPGSKAAPLAEDQPVKIDQMKMPDVVGVRLGMTAEDAVAALHKAYPGDLFVPIHANGWPGAPKPDYGYNVHSREPGNFKDMVVSFTAPPGPQLVWDVGRSTQRMHINRNTLIAALREKYGRETIAYASPGFVAKSDAQIQELIWLYDEHGVRVPLPPGTVFRNADAGVTECLSGGGNTEPRMPTDNDWANGTDEWCKSHLVALAISIGPLDIVEYTTTNMMDLPLSIRTANAASVWLRNYAQQQHQRDLENSKGKKPVL